MLPSERGNTLPNSSGLWYVVVRQLGADLRNALHAGPYANKNAWIISLDMIKNVLYGTTRSPCTYMIALIWLERLNKQALLKWSIQMSSGHISWSMLLMLQVQKYKLLRGFLETMEKGVNVRAESFSGRLEPPQFQCYTRISYARICHIVAIFAHTSHRLASFSTSTASMWHKYVSKETITLA